MSVLAIAGNLKPASRTLEAARNVARSLIGEEPDAVIDVVSLGLGLLAFGDASVAEVIGELCRADVVVVASPTYKGTFTGVLKCLLDLVPPNGLNGVVAVPVMLGAGAGHRLAPEVFLKPVLVELGATCPTRGLYLLERSYDDPAAIADWLSSAVPAVAACRVAVRRAWSGDS